MRRNGDIKVMSNRRAGRKIDKILVRLTERLVTAYKPEKVVLFGSYAYGNPTKESDIDLLIVKNTSKPFHKRWAEVCSIVEDILKTIPFSPFVITPKELRGRLARGDMFFKEILSSGEVLYAE